ncbi:hypothetical protein SAMN02745126_05574 [Enhydrobacter aerosaccus]|uniref:UrcA family protein n=1 Tax=Enhydrobacter aerosaccus TaxID=225324 RepID=A0A1T4T3D5_9HYPH|nr:hypothetical protein [Enhydrobacter aerosaccus]SKA34907.1 hypothetical protein SAMN02745126_05574 [Enhydrobacter aerosaccus]
MRFSFVLALSSALLLQACAPAYENGHLSRFINRERETRDACLRAQARQQDDRASAADTVGRAAAASCNAQNDRLIQAMSTADPSGEAEITEAIRKDATMQATRYVLHQRAYPESSSVPYPQ